MPIARHLSAAARRRHWADAARRRDGADAALRGREQAGQGVCLGHGDSALAASPGAEGPERAGQAVPQAARPSALNKASACHSRVPTGDATASALKPRRSGPLAASPVLGHDGEGVRRDLDEALEGRVASRHRAVEPLRRQGGVGWGWGELSQGDVGGGREKVGGGGPSGGW